MPAMSLEWIADGLVMLPAEHRAELVVIADDLLAKKAKT
jgi:hypothetical protein